MNTKNHTAIHKRGLAILAIATAFLQLPATPAAARAAHHADLRDYKATYEAAREQRGAPSGWHGLTCADVLDAVSGVRGCSTGGPAGGLSDRN